MSSASSWSDVARGRIAARDVMNVICSSLREMQDSEGVTMQKVCRYVERRYGSLSRVSRATLLKALRRGVQQGYLVSNGNKYNLNITTSRGRCGCRPSRRKKKSGRCRKRTGLIKRLMKMVFKKKRCKSKKKKRRPRC